MPVRYKRKGPQVSAHGPRVRVVTVLRKCGKILFAYLVYANKLTIASQRIADAN
jgi:hypothetical protein